MDEVELFSPPTVIISPEERPDVLTLAILNPAFARKIILTQLRNCSLELKDILIDLLQRIDNDILYF
jgi:hypothetical protein